MAERSEAVRALALVDKHEGPGEGRSASRASWRKDQVVNQARARARAAYRRSVSLAGGHVNDC